VRAFENEPLLELRRADVRASLDDALRELDARLPLRVGGEASTFASTDPGCPSRVVAVAGRADAAEAVQLAVEAAPAWRARPVAERAEALTRAAGVLRRRRRELAALELRECGKPWAEADADVCEAIDHLEYAARSALALARGPALAQPPGERNALRYEPRGVAVAISPWNFPIAIPAGMIGAALATGNAVVLKPAEQAPACGAALVSALVAGGIPAVSLATGFGDAGAALVADPGVHTIAFTGSSAVGLEIVRAAADTPASQPHVKRVISEMGGKNCILVDADADLDEAVPAILQSAFAYGGQKCSAASRVLAHQAVAPALQERLVGALDALRVGVAEDFGTDVPPLIEAEAQARVNRYADLARREGRLVESRAELPGDGWFVRPMLAFDLPADSTVLADEIFGPLLAVETVPDIATACAIVDALPFALTGGLFSRDNDTIAEVERRLPVGNLYVNREITGAKVGRQPFGGARRSGTGWKVGGPDYPLAFVEPRVVCENTMRHGLEVE
jgi:RHH-type transcriptional regulator, proline utilization regulon repressor / proline dehydrogenase / delta 1-pyrroline-5-carboxylate dehydrogenase